MPTQGEQSPLPVLPVPPPWRNLEEDIDDDRPDQGVPRCLLGQQVHYGENESKPTPETLALSLGETALGTSHSLY